MTEGRPKRALPEGASSLEEFLAKKPYMERLAVPHEEAGTPLESPKMVPMVGLAPFPEGDHIPEGFPLKTDNPPSRG